MLDTKWNTIRDNFTEEEKQSFREAVTGESICPKGVSVELSKLPIELRDKLGKVLLDHINK
jgi:hypothetical protein